MRLCLFHTPACICSDPPREAEQLRKRDEVIRESWIRTMEARIVRDKLTKCYRLEGVNHLETCKDIAEQYATMLKDNRVRRVPRFVSTPMLKILQVQGYKHIDV